MKCPRCHIIMPEIRTSSHYGQSIILDQCTECGGIWVDENELFEIKRGEARIIETQKPPQLRDSIYNDNPLLCPRHHVPLFYFHDINFPDTVNAMKCPVCHSFWFERGDLTKWQEYVTKRFPHRGEDDPWVGKDYTYETKL